MRQVDRLLFVYDADSGLWGAFIDSARKVLRLQGCDLCTITHGVAGERSEWRDCKQELGVPIDYVHRDELDADLSRLLEDRLPAIVAEVGDEHELLLERSVIARCAGSVEDLRGKLLYYAARKDLQIATPES